MELTRNLFKEVSELGYWSNSVGWRDAETGINYDIPLDTQEAAIFQSLSTPQEQEAFAKANYTYIVEYDGEKNIKRIEKGPMWGKNQRRTPNSPAAAANSPTTTKL